MYKKKQITFFIISFFTLFIFIIMFLATLSHTIFAYGVDAGMGGVGEAGGGVGHEGGGPSAGMGGLGEGPAGGNPASGSAGAMGGPGGEPAGIDTTSSENDDGLGGDGDGTGSTTTTTTTTTTAPAAPLPGPVNIVGPNFFGGGCKCSISEVYNKDESLATEDIDEKDIMPPVPATGDETSLSCQVSCYDGGKIKDACNTLNEKYAHIGCGNAEMPESYILTLDDINPVLNFKYTSKSPEYKEAITHLYLYVRAPCTEKGDDFCFNGFDEDCDGSDKIDCKCDKEHLGMVTSKEKDTICVENKLAHNNSAWVNAPKELFMIYDLKDAKGKDVNIVSNGEKWFYCAADEELSFRYPYAEYMSLQSCDKFKPVCLADKNLSCTDMGGTGKWCGVVGFWPSDELEFLPEGESEAMWRDGDSPAIRSLVLSKKEAILKHGSFPSLTEGIDFDEPNFGSSESLGDDSYSLGATGGGFSLDGCSNSNICLSAISPSVSEDLVPSNDTEIPIVESFPDDSSRFICYANGEDSYIAECCSPGSTCANTKRFEVTKEYPYSVRGFWNGGALRSVYNFDEPGANNGFQRVFTRDDSSYSVDLPLDMRGVIGSYTNIVFDVAFDYGDNIKFTIGESTYDISKYSTSPFTPLRWHRIKIPIIDGLVGNKIFFSANPSAINLISAGGFTGNLTFLASNFSYNLSFCPVINLSSNTTNSSGVSVSSQTLLLDNIFFEAKDPTYFCSAYTGEWVSDLDSSKWACKGIPSFEWTGSKCCGDDGKEFFTDTVGGCWENYPVLYENTFKNAVNSEDYRDLLFVDGAAGNSSSKFYFCNFLNTNNKSYGHANILEDSEACAIPGSKFFCDFNNNWSDASSYGYLNDEFSAKTRYNLKKVFPGSSSMSCGVSSFASCCPDNFCFDGKRCVDGRINVPKVDFVPVDYVYLNDSLSSTSDYGVVCTNGNWSVTEKKYSPFHDYSNYCWLKSQCYYQDGSGNSKCYNNKEIVPDFGIKGFTDFYCDNGNWSSRTRFLADSLIDIGDASNKPYSVFCDEVLKDVTLNNNYRLQSESPPINLATFAVNLKEGTKTSVCVLSLDKNANGVFGDKEDNVIIGVPLKKAWGSSNVSEFFIDIDECDNDIDGFQIIKNYSVFTTCPEGNYVNKIYYNNFTKTILFSEKVFDVYIDESFFSKLISWVRAFLHLSPRMGGSFRALEHARDFEFTNLLNNHLYYYKNGQKQISAAKEYKYYTTASNAKKYTYFVYANYLGFNLSLCKVDSSTGAPLYFTPRPLKEGSLSRITCNESNSTLIMELNPTDPYFSENNYWPDLTARLRPR